MLALTCSPATGKLAAAAAGVTRQQVVETTQPYTNTPATAFTQRLSTVKYHSQ
jgi:hypothetical protein